MCIGAGGWDGSVAISASQRLNTGSRYGMGRFLWLWGAGMDPWPFQLLNACTLETAMAWGASYGSGALAWIGGNFSFPPLEHWQQLWLGAIPIALVRRH